MLRQHRCRSILLRTCARVPTLEIARPCPRDRYATRYYTRYIVVLHRTYRGRRRLCRTCVCSLSKSCNAHACKNARAILCSGLGGPFIVNPLTDVEPARVPEAPRTVVLNFFFFFQSTVRRQVWFSRFYKSHNDSACRPRVHRDHNNNTYYDNGIFHVIGVRVMSMRRSLRSKCIVCKIEFENTDV